MIEITVQVVRIAQPENVIVGRGSQVDSGWRNAEETTGSDTRGE